MKRTICLLVLAGFSATSNIVAVENSTANKLALDDCLRMGLEGNATLRMMQLQLASATAEVEIATARYDARLQLGGSWQDSELPPGSFPSQGGVERGQFTGRIVRGLTSGTQLGFEVDVQRNLFEGVGASSDPNWRTAAGITLQQSVWKNAFGASDRAQVEYVRRRLTALQLDYERVRERVAADIAHQYWRTVTARQVADAQSAMVARLQKLLESNRQKVEEGILDESAVLAVDASLALAEVDREVLRNDMAAQDDRLKDLIDLPIQKWDSTAIDYAAPADDISHVIDASFLDAYEHAIRYRPDLEALRQEVFRVESLIRARRLDDRADVELTGSIGRGDSDSRWGDTLDFDKTLWSVGISVDMSLERSDTLALLTQAYLERDAIRLDMETLERSIALECRAAVRQLSVAQRLVQASRRAWDAQVKKLDLELQRYDRGQSTIATLLDYENDRDAAERDFLRSWSAFQQARIALALAQGTVSTGVMP